jgi:hypothetical protein
LSLAEVRAFVRGEKIIENVLFFFPSITAGSAQGHIHQRLQLFMDYAIFFFHLEAFHFQAEDVV